MSLFLGSFTEANLEQIQSFLKLHRASRYPQPLRALRRWTKNRINTIITKNIYETKWPSFFCTHSFYIVPLHLFKEKTNLLLIFLAHQILVLISHSWMIMSLCCVDGRWPGVTRVTLAVLELSISLWTSSRNRLKTRCGVLFHIT